MKTRISLVLAAFSLLFLQGCQKVYSNLTYDDLMVTEIQYEPDNMSVYSQATTVFVDTVYVILDKNPANNIILSDAFYQNLQQMVSDSLAGRGYTIMTPADTAGGNKPDVVIGMTSLSVINVSQFYYYPTYPSYSPWWWFPWYPWPRVVSVSYTGRVAISAHSTLQVTRANTQDAENIWNVLISAEVGPTTDYYQNLVYKYVNNAFVLSPYFKK